MRAHTDWRFQSVVVPCAQWVTELTAAAAPTSVSLFGSQHYGLSMPSSDFDIVVVVPAGRNAKDVLMKLRDVARASAEEH